MQRTREERRGGDRGQTDIVPGSVLVQQKPEFPELDLTRRDEAEQLKCQLAGFNLTLSQTGEIFFKLLLLFLSVYIV